MAHLIDRWNAHLARRVEGLQRTLVQGSAARSWIVGGGKLC
jgi:hypothetical protein